jgi:zinc transport system permease protein
MLGVTLSIAAKTVGSLILSSLLILPVATAMQISSSYRSTLIWAIGFSLFFILGGLVISFYGGVKPGGSVVLLGVLTYMIVLPLRRRNT